MKTFDPEILLTRFPRIAAVCVMALASCVLNAAYGQFPAAPPHDAVDLNRPIPIRKLIENYRYEQLRDRSYELLQPDLVPDAAEPDPVLDPDLVVDSDAIDDDPDVDLDVDSESVNDPELIDADDSTLDAQVISLDDGRIEVRPRGTDETVVLNVADDVTVTLNRQPADYGALKEGDVVRVTYRGEKPVVAQRISIGRANAEDFELPVAFGTPDQEPAGSEDAVARESEQNLEAVPARDATRQTQTQDASPQRETRPDKRPRAGGLGVVVADSPGRGILVLAVRPNSPAAENGLQTGDYLLEMDGTQLRTPAAFLEKVRTMKPEDIVQVVLWRQGQTLRGTLPLASRDAARDAVSPDGMALVISDKFYDRQNLSTGRTGEKGDSPRSRESKPDNNSSPVESSRGDTRR